MPCIPLGDNFLELEDFALEPHVDGAQPVDGLS